MASDVGPEIVIRGVESKDASVLADLMTQLGYPTQPGEMGVRLQSILARSDYHAAVAVEGGRVIGAVSACWVLSFVRDRQGRVTALIVDENHRDRGVGSALLKEAERWLMSQGAERCVINSATERQDAHRFFERRGYGATGKRFAKDL